jgi:signal transduction histidine kinase
MFNSLRWRLWLTYALLIGGVLGIIFSGLIVYLIRNPFLIRQEFLRLNLLAALVQQREISLENTTTDNLITAAQKVDNTFNVRIVILNPDGSTYIDSRAGVSTPIPRLSSLSENPITPPYPQFHDSQGKIWLYAAHPLVDGKTLLVISPRPRLTIRQLARDEFFRPFIQAGFIALIIALLLALWMSDWISLPLRRISAAVHQVEKGEHQSLPHDGPSEVQELATAFNGMSERVLANQQAQRDFVANVSHDLKTPLTSIQGFAQAILDETASKPEDLHQSAQIIYDEASRMNRLVQDLLDLTRFDSGMVTLEKNPIDIGKLIQSIVEKYKLQARQAMVQIQVDEAPLKPVIGDNDRVTQVFTNLIDNALKHSPQGSRIFIRMSQLDNQVEIKVSDAGPGIPPGDLKRIFERFYQVDKSRSGEKDRGLGLGLAISQEIVLAHGGTISVKNDSPQGCTFTVRLPNNPPVDTSIARRQKNID